MKRSIGLLVVVSFFLATPSHAQESSPEVFQEFLEKWQGQWRGSGVDFEGNEGQGYADCRIVNDGKAMLVTTYWEEASGIWFIVYDQQARRIRAQWGQSLGESSQAILFKDGDQWVQKGTGSTEDGKRIEFTQRITISDEGATHHWKRVHLIDGVEQVASDTWKRFTSPD